MRGERETRREGHSLRQTLGQLSTTHDTKQFVWSSIPVQTSGLRPQYSVPKQYSSTLNFVVSWPSYFLSKLYTICSVLQPPFRRLEAADLPERHNNVDIGVLPISLSPFCHHVQVWDCSHPRTNMTFITPLYIPSEVSIIVQATYALLFQAITLRLGGYGINQRTLHPSHLTVSQSIPHTESTLFLKEFGL